jgi:hypothetical protein
MAGEVRKPHAAVEVCPNPASPYPGLTRFGLTLLPVYVRRSGGKWGLCSAHVQEPWSGAQCYILWQNQAVCSCDDHNIWLAANDPTLALCLQRGFGGDGPVDRFTRPLARQRRARALSFYEIGLEALVAASKSLLQTKHVAFTRRLTNLLGRIWRRHTRL